MPRFKTSAEAEQVYGKIENGKWTDEAKWMIIYHIPPKFNIINSASGKLCTKIYINKDCTKALSDALENLEKRNLIAEFKTFDGCFMIRDVRGLPGRPSTHSYGLAIDLNAKENALGQVPKLSKEFVACFTEAGWSWGGNFTRKDGMHFTTSSWE